MQLRRKWPLRGLIYVKRVEIFSVFAEKRPQFFKIRLSILKKMSKKPGCLHRCLMLAMDEVMNPTSHSTFYWSERFLTIRIIAHRYSFVNISVSQYSTCFTGLVNHKLVSACGILEGRHITSITHYMMIFWILSDERCCVPFLLGSCLSNIYWKTNRSKWLLIN